MQIIKLRSDLTDLRNQRGRRGGYGLPEMEVKCDGTKMDQENNETELDEIDGVRVVAADGKRERWRTKRSEIPS